MKSRVYFLFSLMVMFFLVILMSVAVSETKDISKWMIYWVIVGIGIFSYFLGFVGGERFGQENPMESRDLSQDRVFKLVKDLDEYSVIQDLVTGKMLFIKFNVREYFWPPVNEGDVFVKSGDGLYNIKN